MPSFIHSFDLLLILDSLQKLLVSFLYRKHRERRAKHSSWDGELLVVYMYLRVYPLLIPYNICNCILYAIVFRYIMVWNGHNTNIQRQASLLFQLIT